MHFDIGFKSILASLLCLSGLIANLFIVLSILLQMRCEGSLQTANILMACDSLNNSALVFFIFAIKLAANLKVCPTKDIPGLLFVWEMSTVMEMWGITLICVFYCLKIVPGRGSSSLWLRRNFPLVAAILVGVALTFALTLSLINLNREPATNVTDERDNIPFNSTCPLMQLYDTLVPIKKGVTSLLHISVFSLMTFSCAKLVAHLYSHVRRMRGNQPHMGGAKQQGVTSVAIMIFLLAVEFGSCAIAREWLIIQAAEVISIPLISDLSIVSLALCTLIPITLIAGTSSLRESATSCCFKA